VVKVPIKFLHVVRNPFDNIATLALRKVTRNNFSNSLDIPEAYLQEAINRYFSVCESVMKVKTMVDLANVLDLSHEEFVENPKTQLHQLCYWLGVETSTSYLDACASIVFDSPHKSRYKINWTSSFKEKVETKMCSFPFFKGYSFEN